MFNFKNNLLKKQNTNFIKTDAVNSSYYGDYIDYYKRECDDAIGEINLWRAVLLQALIDLKTKTKKKRFQPIKKEAYDWFSKKENQEEVKVICDCAGISYAKVQKVANEIIKKDHLDEIYR